MLRLANLFFVNEFRPTVRGEDWHIVAIFFECISNDSEVKLSGDHDHHKWINPEEYKTQGVIGNLHKVFEAYLNK